MDIQDETGITGDLPEIDIEGETPTTDAEVKTEAKFDITILDRLTVEELEAVKARATELLKDKKDEIKATEVKTKATIQAERAAKAKAEVVKDAEITFTMKGQIRNAKVIKVSDKTATVKLPEGTRYIQFKFITDVKAPVVPKAVEAKDGTEVENAA